jgi:hypothetical protein
MITETWMTPTCDRCAYSDEGEAPFDTKDGMWLLCRRRPPVVFRSADDGYAGGPGVFPRVHRDDWCGEWVECGVNTGRLKQATFLSNEWEMAKDCFEEKAKDRRR